MFKKVSFLIVFIMTVDITKSIYLANPEQDIESQNTGKNFPVGVELLDRYKIPCGTGVFIDSNWILTCAHIETSTPKILLNGIKSEIDLSIKHPLYKNLGYLGNENDICLLRLKNPAQTSPIERIRGFNHYTSIIWQTGFGRTNYRLNRRKYRVCSTLFDLTQPIERHKFRYLNLKELKKLDIPLPGVNLDGDSGGGNYINTKELKSNVPPKNVSDFYNHYKLIGINSEVHNFEGMLFANHLYSFNVPVDISLSSNNSWLDKIILIEVLGAFEKNLQFQGYLIPKKDLQTNKYLNFYRIDPHWMLQIQERDLSKTIEIDEKEYKIDSIQSSPNSDIKLFRFDHLINNYIRPNNITAIKLYDLKDSQNNDILKLLRDNKGYTFNITEENNKRYQRFHEEYPWFTQENIPGLNDLLLINSDNYNWCNKIILEDALK